MKAHKTGNILQTIDFAVNSDDFSPIDSVKTHTAYSLLFQVCLMHVARIAAEEDSISLLMDKLLQFARAYSRAHLSGALSDKTIADCVSKAMDAQIMGTNNLALKHFDNAEEVIVFNIKVRA